MRRRARLARVGALLAGIASLVTVPLALAEATERLSVGNDPAGRGHPKSLFIVLRSPADYTRERLGRFGDNGVWTGPRYQATGQASLGGDAKIDWDINFVRGARDLRATMIAQRVHGWPVSEEGVQPVSHRVGGRLLGTVRGQWLLTRSPLSGADDARYEALLAFPICSRLVTVTRFAFLLPSSNDAGGNIGYGRYYMVKDGSPPTAWNRARALDSIAGVSIEGNLPAGFVRTAARGRTIRGTAADCHRHALVGARVQLQVRIGRRWRTVRYGRTNASGRFTLTIRSRGLYRAVVAGRPGGPVRVR